MSPLRLCLVRHGETAWNAEHRLQGWTDVPLNATGQRQAQALARALAPQAFDAIVSSPLQRALRTAEAVAAGRALPPIELEPRLKERHHGALQGHTRDEIAHSHPELHAALVQRRPDYLPPGGEALADFAQRVHAALEALRQRHAGRTVLAVAHGGVLDVAYRLAACLPLHAPRERALPNAAINWLVAGPEGWRVEAFGLDAHLGEALDDQGG